MRVISGSFKGRKLASPKGLHIRPTPDKVRGALFNIIGWAIEDSLFLDLFAGTGAIGIEALSRGAYEVVFVDNNNVAIKIIKKNLEDLGFHCNYELQTPDYRLKIIRGDATEIIGKFKPRQFDFIFLDPPYKSDLGEKVLMEIFRYNILKESGEIIWEHYYKTKPTGDTAIKLKRTVRYGDTALSFFCY